MNTRRGSLYGDLRCGWTVCDRQGEGDHPVIVITEEEEAAMVERVAQWMWPGWDLLSGTLQRDGRRKVRRVLYGEET